MDSIQPTSLKAFVQAFPEVNKVQAWALKTKIFVAMGTITAIAAGALVITGFKISLAALVLTAAFAIFTAAAVDRSRAHADLQFLHRYADWIRSFINEKVPDAFIHEKINDLIEVYEHRFPTILFDNENKQAIITSFQKHQKLSVMREDFTAFLQKKFKEMEFPIDFPKDAPLAPPTMHDLETFDDIVLKLCNCVNECELEDLRRRLTIKVGGDLADQIMADWDILGQDVKTNKAVLTEARKLKILEKAVKAKESCEKVDAILPKLKEDLKKGLPLDFKTYGLDGIMSDVPETKKKILNQLLAREAVLREIRYNTHFRGSKIEGSVVENLGFDVKEFHKQQEAQKRIRETLEDILKHDDLPSVKLLKKQIDKMAFKTRMEVAGVSSAQMPHIRTAIKEFSQFKTRERAKAILFEKTFSESLDVQLPKARRLLEQWYRGGNQTAISDALNDVLKTNKDAILLGQKSLLDFPVHLDDAFQKKEIDLEKAVKWFQKYQDTFVIEYAQGEDDASEALGDGVCAALGFRLARNTLFLPDEPPEALQLDRILPQDRMLQATYQVAKDLAIRFPPDVIARKGVKEKILFMADKDNIQAAITAQMGLLGASNGGLQLGCGGHATFMRLDHKRKMYLFMEPNFGTQVFKPKYKETPDEIALRMAECYAELYDWAYPTHSNLFGSQVLPLGKKEKPSFDFDLATLKKYIG